MNLKKNILQIILLTGFLSAQAQIKTRTYVADEKLAPREHNVDMQHMKLELTFEAEKGIVNGIVTHTFIPLQKQVDTLFLDAIGIHIKDAKLDGKTIQFKTNESGVTLYFNSPLTWGSTHQLTMNYSATPRRGLYFVGWNVPEGESRRQIWSQGQGINNRHWIPSYDEMNDQLTTEFLVKFDSKYKVLSNGVLLSEKTNKDGTKTWHYKMNKRHAPYLVMLGIGDYKIKKIKSEGGVPINLWYYPDWENRVDIAYKYSAEMMDFLEKEIGVKYPWESYSQIPVRDFLHGAMENTTATVFGDFLFVDERSYHDRNYIAVNAHELAHQWFGDFITARTSSHVWLQESFATHYNMLYEREVFGQDFFDWDRRAAGNASIKESKNNYNPIAHSRAGRIRIYPKGATVMFMLKYVIGKEEWVKSMKHYLNRHAYNNVDTEDLLIAFNETTGRALDWFWEQWLYKGGEPHYNVTYQDVTIKGKRLTEFSVTQVHETNDVVGLFRMPIVFEVVYKDGTKDSKKVWIENKQHTVMVPNPKEKVIDFVLFDPNEMVMKKATFEKPLEMLLSQAINATHMLDRYDAIRAMRDTDVPLKQDVLIKAFDNEKFHIIKGEVISQLINESDEKSKALIRKAITDKDEKVRKAVMNLTGSIPADMLPDYEKLLKTRSYELQAQALDKLCFEYPAKTKDYLEMTKDEVGAVGKNVRIKWLEISYHFTKNKTHVEELVGYVGKANDFRERGYAAEALKRLDYFSADLMEHLFDGICHTNWKISRPCGEALKYFYDQTSHKKIIASYYKSKQWKDYEKKAISKWLD